MPWLRPGEYYRFPVKTHDPNSEALADPSSGPTVLVYHNDALDTGVVTTVTRLGVGDFAITVLIPASYPVGDFIRIDIAATVAGRADQETFLNERLVSRDPSEPCPTLPTPAPSTDPSVLRFPVSCDELAVVRPVIPIIEGVEVPQRRLGLRLDQGQEATLEWMFRDNFGRPIDLSHCVGLSSRSSGSSAGSLAGGTDDQFAAVFREVLDEGRMPLATAYGQIQNVTDGTVRFQLPGNVVDVNGVIQAELAVMAPSGRPRIVNTCYLIIDRSSFAPKGGYTRRGCPLVAELRTFLLDSSASDNYLLATIEHELGEVGYAMLQAVSDWNSFMPGIGPAYTTTTFIDPETLVEGIAGYLLMAAANNYRRNHLAYQAAGVALDDKNKEATYTKAAQEYLGLYTKWVRTQKVRANKEAWSGFSSSPYRRTYRGRGF